MKKNKKLKKGIIFIGTKFCSFCKVFLKIVVELVFGSIKAGFMSIFNNGNQSVFKSYELVSNFTRIYCC